MEYFDEDEAILISFFFPDMAARHVSWRCLRALWSDCRDKLRLLKSLRDGRVVCRVGVLTVGMTRLGDGWMVAAVEFRTTYRC